MRRPIIFGAVFVLAALLFPHTRAESAAKQYSLVVGTVAGTMGRLGAGMSEAFNRKSKDIKLAVVPGGGRSNPARVGSGGADIGFTFTNFARPAMAGKAPFKKAYPNLRGVIKLWDSVYHQYIAKELYDSGIHSWADIVKSKKPLRVGVAKKGTSTEYISRLIVQHYGLTYDDLTKRGFKLTYTGVGAMSRAFTGRQIDIWFHNAGPPNAAGIQAAIGRPLTFMKLPQEVVKALGESGFTPASIPAGTYKGMTGPAHSVGASGIVFTTEKMDPNAIYSLLKITFESKKFLSGVHKIYKKLDPKVNSQGIGIPLHEGAIRYYKEKGVKF